MRLIPRTWLLIAVAAVLACVTGCTQAYHFEVTLVVRDAATGEPLPGAEATFDFSHADYDPAQAVTDRAGQLTHNFWLARGEFSGTFRDRPWPLRVQRDGFVSEEVNIRPAFEPKGGATPIVVVVYLRPTK